MSYSTYRRGLTAARAAGRASRCAAPSLAATGLILFGATGSFARPVRADDTQPRIAIADAAFTPAIADRQPEQRITTAAAGQEPYFWTLLSANAAVLETLRAQGKLPIQHIWLRYVGPVVLEKADLSKLGNGIPLDVGTAALADKLQLEVDHSPNRSFTWRTWSQKGSLRAGSWSVFMKYADGTPVICQVIDGAGVPCVYHLEVHGP